MLLILARAISGTNPPEDCPSWTLRRVSGSASSSTRNLARVWFQPSFFEAGLFAELTGLYLLSSLVDCLVRWGPDEDATGAGAGISGGAPSYKIS